MLPTDLAMKRFEIVLFRIQRRLKPPPCKGRSLLRPKPGKKTLNAALYLGLLLAVTHLAQGQTPGILGTTAPRWGVTDWFNLPDGSKSLDIGDFKGKVLYLYCFQSW